MGPLSHPNARARHLHETNADSLAWTLSSDRINSRKRHFDTYETTNTEAFPLFIGLTETFFAVLY